MEVVVSNGYNTLKTEALSATVMSLTLISLKQYKKYEPKVKELKLAFQNLLDANVPNWRQQKEYRFLL